MATAMVQVPARPQRWHTLHLLQVGRTLILLLDALLFIAVVSATEAHRAALKTVGRDAAPSIIAAQHIKTAVAGMDVDVANELLNSPENSAPSLSNYDAERTDAATSLVTAAENITYGEAERGPIRTLQNGLAVYEDLAQRARDFHEDLKGADAKGDTALDAYRQAETMTDRSLLPAADDLDRANDAVLETTYRSESFWSAGSRFFILVAALALLFTLAVAQVMMSQRMHRTLNLPLLAATLLLAVVALRGISAVSSSHRDLKRAKEDAFTSIRALWRARATAYAANSEESRYLLDPAHAAAEERSFLGHAAALATEPADLSPEQLIAAEREGHRVDGFTGYLADELNNVTFHGEREAALETVAAWERYRALDGEIRRLEHAGQHARAVELCIGTQPGESDWAFARFDRALGRTLAINQGAFDAAVEDGFGDLRNLELLAGVAALVAAGLVLWGFAPRIREYL